MGTLGQDRASEAHDALKFEIGGRLNVLRGLTVPDAVLDIARTASI
jgi:hypothetical protein